MGTTDFQRPNLTSPDVQPPTAGFRGLGVLVAILLLGGAAAVGYKIITTGVPAAPATQQDRSAAKIQEQLNNIEKRLDRLEKYRISVAKTSPRDGAAEREPAAAPKTASLLKDSLKSAVADSSTVQPEVPSEAATAVTQPAPASGQESVADHQEWQATADQLTDVVGIIGTQQTELSNTQKQLGQLSAQTQRFAVPFELRRGSRPQMVGPVSLELKSSDPRGQRYSISVLLDDKPVEFRNRAVDELVDFVLPGESEPLRFVATKIGRDSIGGYVEVPGSRRPR
ncbi:MAG TPA: hypothetical protein VKB26_06935 [Candidatus Acidoferrales bacterium]|nr:hypothetical protein [Candidatus Acidoferrales bacterium]